MVTLVGTAVVVLVVAGWVGYEVRWNVRSLRLEKPLREEIRARPATFRLQVEVKDLRGGACLSVHGDAFEVAQKFPVIGFLNGTDYCYRARDTTVEAAHGLLHDWIMLRGMPGTGARALEIGHRKVNSLLWDALVSAGAHPLGPPPQR
jgi:hypothetical protein